MSSLIFRLIRQFSEDFPPPLAPRVFAKREVVEEARNDVAKKLGVGKIMRLAPCVLLAPSPIGIHPDPWMIARALCVQNDWRVTLPVSMARFFLGLESRPTGYNVFRYDQPEARDYPDRGLTFEPEPRPDLFDMTPAGQAVAIGIPADASLARLREIGEFAARAWFSEERMKIWLAEDLRAGRLGEREQIMAWTILADYRGVVRHAPPDFDPDQHAGAPRADYWRLADSPSRGTHIVANAVSGHPHIPDGSGLHTTALVWVDEGLGWARTRSRTYRLGRKARS